MAAQHFRDVPATRDQFEFADAVFALSSEALGIERRMRPREIASQAVDQGTIEEVF